MRISPSGLKLFNACQGAFALRYLHKETEEDNEFAKVGRQVHQLIEAKLQNDPQKLPDAATQEALDIYQTFEKRFLPDIEPKNMLVQEELIETQLGDHVLAFKADYIEDVGGFLTITDWKTGFKFLTVEEMKKDEQVRAYVVGALKLYPHHDVAVFIIKNIRLAQSQYLEVTRAEAEVWEASLTAEMALIGARVKGYEAGNKDAFPFMPGAYCTVCGYFSKCPAAQKALKTPKKASQSLYLPPKNKVGATSLAQRLNLIGRHWEEAKKALKVWVEEHGSVPTAGVIWGIFAEEKLVIDEGVIPEALKDRIQRYYKLDTTQKSGIWQDTALMEELKKAGALRAKATVSFTGKKVKETEDA